MPFMGAPSRIQLLITTRTLFAATVVCPPTVVYVPVDTGVMVV